ncbi:Uncharacterized protein dnm_050560 [Desulfonema magnum]|uniref:Uncharacterized protein n=1 Tax=Desulfonema magnum TaxID=45655 RepID=A0A975GPN2_9BACT|nr:Uncharacterized protein dnm_050560 [Desulfonema magnum]
MTFFSESISFPGWNVWKRDDEITGAGDRKVFDLLTIDKF